MFKDNKNVPCDLNLIVLLRFITQKYVFIKLLPNKVDKLNITETSLYSNGFILFVMLLSIYALYKFIL